MKIKNEHEFLPSKVWIVLAFFFLIYLLAGNIRFDFPDFQDHSKAAERIAGGGLLYRDHVSYLNVYHYPPVFLYTLGAVYYFSGVSLLTAKGFLAVFNILAAVLLYLIIRDFRDEKDAFSSLILFLVNPLTFSAVYVGYFDNFVVFFILLSVYFLLRDKPLLGGSVLAAGFMSKPFAILLLFVIIPYYLKQHRSRFLSKVILAFLLSTILISIPFLVLTPGEFINYAFLYNFERASSSLSLYYYFLPWLGTSFFPFALQAAFAGWFSYSVFKSKNTGFSLFLDNTLFLYLGFLVLNRINYPHYLIYTVPFLSFIIVKEFGSKTRTFRFPVWKHIILVYSVILFGVLVWSYPWSQGVIDFKSSGYFWIGSGIYFFGCFYFLVFFYFKRSFPSL